MSNGRTAFDCAFMKASSSVRGRLAQRARGAFETLSDDYVDHTNPPGWPLGREGHRQILALYHAAFTDFRYDIEYEVAEGDMVDLYRHAHRGVFWHCPDRRTHHDNGDASLAYR